MAGARAIHVGLDGTVRVPAATGAEVGFTPGMAVRPMPQGRCIVLVPDVDVRQLRGSARGADLDRIGDE